METGIQSSFIPRDAAQATIGARLQRGSFLDLGVLISIVLFIASIVLGAGVFLYQQFLETSSKSKVEQLDRAKAAFEPALIQQFTRLDDRMRDADKILANHIAPSAFFHMLEEVTLTTVSFISLEFEASDPQNMTIRMNGIARSVNSIALQADLFSKNGIITSPIFSDIDRQQDGVHFSLSAFVNPASIRYVQLAGAGAGGESSMPISPSQPSPSTAVPVTTTPAASPSPSSSPSPALPLSSPDTQPPPQPQSGGPLQQL